MTSHPLLPFLKTWYNAYPDLHLRTSRMSRRRLARYEAWNNNWDILTHASAQLRIVAKDEQGLSSAKRLASRAIHEVRLSR